MRPQPKVDTLTYFSSAAIAFAFKTSSKTSALSIFCRIYKRISISVVIFQYWCPPLGQANHVPNRWFYNSIIFLEPSVFIHSFSKTPLFGTTHNKTLDKISLDNKKVPSLKQCVATGRQATFSYLKFFGWLSFIVDNVLD